MKEIKTATLTFKCLGPDLHIQGVKTVFYFSLSAEDSLSTSPFSNPAKMLEQKGLRVLSPTLPFHEENKRPNSIKAVWGENKDALIAFLADLEIAIDELTPSFSGHLGVAGLSRGAFIATHIGSRMPQISSILGFAPLTHLYSTQELDIIHLAPKLIHKKIRYFIGHNDTLVGTQNAIDAVSAFINAAQKVKIANPPMGIDIKPSVGREGHGTLDYVFEEGTEWLIKNL